MSARACTLLAVPETADLIAPVAVAPDATIGEQAEVHEERGGAHRERPALEDELAEEEHVVVREVALEQPAVLDRYLSW